MDSSFFLNVFKFPFFSCSTLQNLELMLKIAGKDLGLPGLWERSFQCVFSTAEVVLRAANVNVEVSVQH